MRIINRLLLSCCLVSTVSCGGGGNAIAQSSSVNPPFPDSSSPSVSSSVASSSRSAAVDALYPSYNLNPAPADNTGMPSKAVDIASKINLGWNIGNTLEAIGGETAWGNPMVTNKLIQLVKNNGFEAIRIPVSWNQYANQETAEISAIWLDRVKDVVQLCVDNGVYVIVNIHWDGGWLENNVTSDKQAANVAKQKAFWEQIATHLREFDEHVMFAGTNEPNVDTAEQMDVLLAYHQTFINAVRATGGRNAYRVLIIQGPATDIEKTHKLWTQMPDDSVADRLMVEVHFYTPFNFTLMREDTSWGKQFYYWGEDFHSLTDTEHNPTWGEEPFVTDLFELMQQQFVAQGIPVILGEFGAMRRDNLAGKALELHLASRAHYLKYVTQEAVDKGLIPFYWDSGALNNFGSGIFNRQENTVFDQQALDGLLQGAGKQ